MGKTISFERSIGSDNPMTKEELRCAERVLAKLIAAAYVSDHPEAFGSNVAGEPIMGEHQTCALELLGAGFDDLKAGGAHAENE
jgi:hypothetical protein